MEKTVFPGSDVDAQERALIACQMGREVRGDVGVMTRCEFGLPVVLRTSPTLENGAPFPTLFYLVCPMAVRAIGRLEAGGRMAEMQALIESDAAVRDEYAKAHERYRALRDSLGMIDEPMTAGGMPGRVKCLHALYAQELADANPVGAVVREQIEPLGCPEPCVRATEADRMVRAAGHPGFAGKKRRAEDGA